jgi:serine/threonine protein phosphatase PrpC
MSHPEPRIQCFNSQCLASNDLEAILCDRCNTPIIRRYLWSSQAIASEQKQTLIQERYLALTEQIFLDTQPSSPPLTPEEVPPEIVVYLQLFSYYPHIPQPYGLLSDRQIWLFDYGTVPASPTGELAYPQELIPQAQDLWLGATPLQQLNWLWQIAKLWHPLSQKGVAATLLEPNLIRVNGQILQLRQLQTDIDRAASLQDLGNLWSRWATHAHPNIKEVVFKLASNLETGVIAQANQLVGLLDRAISLYCQTQQYSYQTHAQSDSGPSRSNNEDAAYPLSSHPQEITATKNGKNGLAIVCDGVGGHDGGEIASRETIDYLQGKISALKLDKLKPHKISSKLAQYIKDANDLINQRNDAEHRQERQRMGTTLVMALARAQEMYLAHIGDSRIYWITRNSCHQMTIDDDLASREVRLGYALYRDSLEVKQELIQFLNLQSESHHKMFEILSGSSTDAEGTAKIDLEKLENIPLPNLETIVESLKKDLEKVARFVSDQEEELGWQCKAVEELEVKMSQVNDFERFTLEQELADEKEAKKMLDQTLVGQRRSLKERHQVLLQHSRVLKRRQGIVDFDFESAIQDIDLTPIKQILEQQQQEQQQQQQQLNSEVNQIKLNIQELIAKLEQERTLKSQLEQEIAQLQDKRHELNLQTAATQFQIDFYQHELQPLQDTLDQINHQVTEMEKLLIDSEASSSGMAVSKIEQLVNELAT